MVIELKRSTTTGLDDAPHTVPQGRAPQPRPGRAGEEGEARAPVGGRVGRGATTQPQGGLGEERARAAATQLQRGLGASEGERKALEP